MAIDKRKLKKTFNTVYLIASTAVIFTALIFAVLFACGVRIYRVSSGSMGDLLPVGSACIVSTYSSYDSIKAGDIISFKVNNGLFVTHRAYSVTDEGIYTWGDENDTPDPDPVTKENYIGRTVFAIPYAGAVLASFQTPCW